MEQRCDASQRERIETQCGRTGRRWAAVLRRLRYGREKRIFEVHCEVRHFEAELRHANLKKLHVARQMRNAHLEYP